ncbi:tyrosine- kinase Fer isoform X1 [Paramuricea clavata]|uniref:Tyrosine- kinase Fer isoform X1 n=1 Tax=Paramuricea clavata TaxID=317549 RepID=A0A7D9JMD7_PARCT|nr:tyrosine- kinase Fer isoform X1 [Paramuricea clavata]
MRRVHPDHMIKAHDGRENGSNDLKDDDDEPEVSISESGEQTVADDNGEIATEIDPPIYLCIEKIKRVKTIKSLGLMLDETLSWNEQMNAITTKVNRAIIDQVLTGEQGCRGVFRGWIDNRSNPTKDPLVTTNLEKLCQRAVFVAPSYSFEPFVTDNCKGDEKSFIERLSIFHVSSTYKVKVLQIVLRSKLCMRQQQVSTYDVVMNGKKCLLKLHQHTREDVLKTDLLKSVPLRKEIEIVRVLNAAAEPCPYIVRLLGSSIEAPMHLIIERTPKNDLLTYLRGFVNAPETKEMFQFAVDVCKAMIYLGEQNLIHRDLCAKNCFVFMENGILLTKLGDFHLASLSYPGPKSPTGRQSSITRKVNDISNEFAVRWMAIEVFQFGEFRTASDVWSFGVLLSEIFTFGCKPYVNMPSGLSLERDEEVREFVSTLMSFGNKLVS